MQRISTDSSHCMALLEQLFDIYNISPSKKVRSDFINLLSNSCKYLARIHFAMIRDDDVFKLYEKFHGQMSGIFDLLVQEAVDTASDAKDLADTIGIFCNF